MHVEMSRLSSTTVGDQLLTVLMSKVLTIPVVSEINFRVESIALAKTQRLASFRPAASAWETMNVSSNW